MPYDPGIMCDTTRNPDRGSLATGSSLRGSDLLALGFGTTVAMWAVGYVARFPHVLLPGWLMLVFMLACLFGGGIVCARLTGRGWRGGLLVGVIASLLNLLILGSLLTGDQPNRVVPSALWWIPGSLAIGAVLAGCGAVLGGAGKRSSPRQRDYNSLFASVAAIATGLLIIAGGIVTGAGAGLDVPDWPRSFRYNMFLFPLSRMTGGIYYEHAHRLLGSLVGLTVLVLAVQLWRTDRRAWVRLLGTATLLLVIVQGVMGGLRVTQQSTLLAITHGVTGQLILGMVVGLAVVSSHVWRQAEATAPHPSAATDRMLCVLLPVTMVIQIALGAVQRHLDQGLLAHITVAIGVAGLAILCSLRIWGFHRQVEPLARLGRGLVPLVAAQIGLGVAALAVTQLLAGEGGPALASVFITTLHQALGAFLLAWAVMLMIWARRLLTPVEAVRGHVGTGQASDPL